MDIYCTFSSRLIRIFGGSRFSTVMGSWQRRYTVSSSWAVSARSAADSCCPKPLVPHASFHFPGRLGSRLFRPFSAACSTHGTLRFHSRSALSHSPTATLRRGEDRGRRRGDQDDRRGAQVPEPATSKSFLMTSLWSVLLSFSANMVRSLVKLMGP